VSEEEQLSEETKRFRRLEVGWMETIALVNKRADGLARRNEALYRLACAECRKVFDGADRATLTGGK